MFTEIFDILYFTNMGVFRLFYKLIVQQNTVFWKYNKGDLVAALYTAIRKMWLDFLIHSTRYFG